MKGDFSNWRFKPQDNFNGVLHQQGRVVTDLGFTDSDRIGLHWREQNAQDVVGAGVAAVPAGESDGFKIVTALVNTVQAAKRVEVTVRPGRVWADGLLAFLAGATPDSPAPVMRVATYLDPPIQTPPAAAAGLAAGVRDAVILEVWHEEINGFQDPGKLLEPALGDLDTTERVHTSFQFRLFRLGPDQTCRNIADLLQDKASQKGKLRATLTPTVVVPADCPVVAEGGYTGFEHLLYRIEIAHGASVSPGRFKFSRFNGGLVGRGEFKAGVNPQRFNITANRAAILNSGITSFYLEALGFDAERGFWRPVYGAQATLNAQNELAVADPPVFGAVPGEGNDVFFRLWDGIRDISGFTNSGAPQLLVDGIHLVFDAPTATNYRPGAYWTFPVRVGQTEPLTLLDNQRPEGIVYHRVALAEIDWGAALRTTVDGYLHDCRRRFLPLTNQRACCTFFVGDGVTTFGDFNSLEEAAVELPPDGGELCLMPGSHFTNLVLEGKKNITIHGCRARTLLMPGPGKETNPILKFTDCSEIRLANFDMVTFDGIAVLSRSSTETAAKDFRVEGLRILAGRNAIRVDGGLRIQISRNELWVMDKESGSAAVSVAADDVLIERNRIEVWPVKTIRPVQTPNEGEGPKSPTDPCAESGDLYANPVYVYTYATAVWATFELFSAKAFTALGGIHVRAGSEVVRILENSVRGGAGNGITLGGLLPGDEISPSENSEDITRAPQVIRLVAEDFIGVVQDKGAITLSRVQVYLQGPENQDDLSDSNGRVEMSVAPGVYSVSTGPKYEITAVHQETVDGRTLHRIIVEAARGGREDAAYLQVIEISRNVIQQMGLNGISSGFRPEEDLPTGAFAAKPSMTKDIKVTHENTFLAQLTPQNVLRRVAPLRDIEIRSNRIIENLRDVFTTDMREQAMVLGSGGISIHYAEDVVISDNYILDNGPDSADPVCGIYLAWVEQAEIGSNMISGNGKNALDATDLVEGIRSGIAVAFASGFNLRSGDAHKPALRVHDNIVHQPVGRGLTVFAMGPVSCADNHFNSERTGRWGFFDVAAGGVLIANLGGVHRLLRRQATKARAGGSFANPSNLSMAQGNESAAASAAAAERILPGGETLFNGNQVRLGPAHNALVSVAIGSLDDLGFDGNQSSVFHDTVLFSNCVLAGVTVRATDSRFSEAAPLTWSLLSAALQANITAHNIGDHCIVTIGPQVMAPDGSGLFATVPRPNVELIQAQCDELRQRDHFFLQYVMSVILGFRGAGQTPPVKVESVDIRYAQQFAGKAYSTIGKGQTARGYMLERETERMAVKYGEESPKVRTLRAQVERGAAVRQELNGLADKVQIQPQKPIAEAAVFEGRVSDVYNRGRAGLTVQLVNEKGEAVHSLGVTDENGHYAATLDRAAIKGIGAKTKIFVQVVDKEGVEVGRATTPAKLAIGSLVSDSLKISRRFVAGEPQAKPSPKREKSKDKSKEKSKKDKS